MSWKKIVGLVLVLLLFIVAIYFVNRQEEKKKAVEGTLYTLKGDDINKIELIARNHKYVFTKKENQWLLLEPMATKADRVAVEGIVDNFATLKYDKRVEQSATSADLQKYGLATPDFTLHLYASDTSKPVQTVLIGAKNELDQGSYLKTAASTEVVLVSATRRGAVERELFDFRAKVFFEFNSADIESLSFTNDTAAFAFNRKDNRWWLDKPLSALAKEAKVADLLAKASALPAKAFKDTVSEERKKEYGLDKPVASFQFREKGRTRQLDVGKKGEAYFACSSDFAEICEIDKDLLDKAARELKEWRETKVGLFNAYDVKEIAYKGPALALAARKGADENWQLVPPGTLKASGDKIGRFVSAIEGLEAGDFAASAPAGVAFKHEITVKAGGIDPKAPLTTQTIMLSELQGDTVWAKSSLVPYLFKLPKDTLEKLPKKADDWQEDKPVAPAVQK
jgi:hypothetical protein